VKSGSGGDGGKAGRVDVTNNGVITTQGGLSYGIQATSAGGGGGASGLSASGTITLGNVQNGQGGDGGNGGVGGIAQITTGQNSRVSTAGDKAIGLLAHSIGGAGGAGGSVYSGSLSIADVSDNVGGSGGDGGTASDVAINSVGAVHTTGNSAMGIVAQSIGGDGGVGGLASNLSITASLPDVPQANITSSVGGDGGDGGKSGTVSVVNDAAVTTTGSQSDGIIAQTIGGSGGLGGAVLSANLNFVPTGTINLSVDVGGDGGDGGIADTAEVINKGSIKTTGNKSSAVFAQSIGGHGGTGGNSYFGSANLGAPKDVSLDITVGGGGGDGVQGGNVKVINSSSLETGRVDTSGNVTRGIDSHGIFAQSIGGSGGVGGVSMGAAGNLGRAQSEYFNMNATVSVGGSGGSAQHAGTITVDNSGSIVTKSDTAFGIYAQSIGGGGGHGGNATELAGAYFRRSDGIEKNNLKISYTLGGTGGAAGDGNTVSVTNNAAITTSGVSSYGIIAQSIGGGGGNGGNGPVASGGVLDELVDVGELGWSAYELVNELKKVYGKNWRQLLASSWALDIGGKGGASGDGGLVTVNNTQTLTTSGASGTAIYAQSVGGGGGSGGDGTQETITEIGVAGGDSGGGDGGDVKVTSSGDIFTSGDGAMGIHVQSLGGGGGNAGDVEAGFFDQISGLAETLGAQVFAPIDGQHGGDGGNGGAVTVTMAGNLTTTGENAHGIFAHSVGGGGGAAPELGAGTKVKIGSAGNSGNSGLVSVSVPGSVIVSGDGAHGIFAQSVAGKDSTNGGVEVNVSGTVKAGGQNGRAILVQADTATLPTSSGVSNITVEKAGVVHKDDHEDMNGAIGFLSGTSVIDGNGKITTSNTLTNQGLIVSKNVVVESDGNSALRLNNFGTMTGRLQFLGHAQTEITIEQGGTFNLGNSNFGTASGSVFTNNGTLKPGWLRDTRKFTIKSGGAFVQTNNGRLMFDADLSSGQVENGQLVLDTASAKLDGTVVANFIDQSDLKNGVKGTFEDVVTYIGAGSFEKDKLTAPSGTAVAYDLNWDENNSLSIDFEVDYTGAKSGAPLALNQRRFGTYLGSAIGRLPDTGERDSQSNTLSDLGAHTLNAENSQQLASIYDEHILDEAAIGTQLALSAAQGIHNFLNSCPNLNASDPETFYRQQDCFWGQAIGQTTDQDVTETMPGFDERTSGFAIGAQKEFGPGWFIEGGAQYTQTSVSGDNFTMDGDQFSAGIALKKEIGIFEFSGSVAGGTFDNDHIREYSVSSDRHRASGDIKGYFASAAFRASAIYEIGSSYIKPNASLLITHISQDEFSEFGTGDLNWDVDGVEHTAIYLQPMLELGRSFNWSQGDAVGFIRAGVTHQLTDPEIEIRSRLNGGGVDFGDLGLTVASDRTQFDVSIGAIAELENGLSLELIGSSAFSDSRKTHEGQIRVQWQF